MQVISSSAIPTSFLFGAFDKITPLAFSESSRIAPLLTIAFETR